MYLHEQAREAGWTDGQILEGLAAASLAGSPPWSPSPATCPPKGRPRAPASCGLRDRGRGRRLGISALDD